MENESYNEVGQGIAAGNASWTFGDNVAKTFTTHVQQSVPLYLEGQDLIATLSDFFIRDTSAVYELGTSTGTLIGKIARRHSRKSARLFGIDIVPSMIEQATAENSIANIEYLVGDIVTFPYEKSDFIVAYYTIQFIEPSLRQTVINRIYESLNWGGAFVLFEKVRAPDARFQDYMTATYHEFKLSNGYTPQEIFSKARSLKRVLEPFSTDGNIQLMRRAGFVDIMSIMKYACFEGFLAIK